MSKAKAKNFVELVQRNGISQPSHGGKFSRENWELEYLKRSSPSLAETRLYESGLWFHERFTSIQARVSRLDFGDFTLDELIRLHSGFQNHDAFLLSRSKFKSKDTQLIASSDLIQASVPLVGMPEGATPDAILETGIDGLKISLDSLFLIESVRLRDADDEGVIRAIHEHLNLGASFDHLIDLWNECVWLGAYVDVSGDVDLIVSASREREVVAAVGRYRINALTVELSVGLVQNWKKIPKEIRKSKNKNVRELKSIVGSGNSRRFKYGLWDAEELPIQKIFKIVLEELYFAGMLEWSLPDTPGVKLETLLDAWAVLSQVAEAIYRKIGSIQGDENRMVFNARYFLMYATSFDRRELQKHLCSCMQISEGIAAKLLSFFIRENSKLGQRQEIWHRPLIELENKKLLPILGALSAPNLMRSVEGWMVSAGLDLAERGPLFEAHARKNIYQAISESCIPNSGVHMVDLKFSADGISEQIDLILWIENIVIIGELKCIVYPAGANGKMNFRATVDGAVEQAKRKSEHVRNNLAAFVACVDGLCNIDVEKISVYPLVVLNSPYEAGCSIDGVPVVDLRIVCRYFDAGEIRNLVERDAAGNTVREGKPVRFYDSVRDAALRFPDYLLRPPQVEVYKRFVTETLEFVLNLEVDQKPAAAQRLVVELPTLAG